jgi:hypothetical protein
METGTELDRVSPETTAFAPLVLPEISGWLLVLCLLLTLVSPAAGLYTIVWHVLPELLQVHRLPITVLSANHCVLFIPLAGFSFIAGMKLWRVKPGAVRFARSYLVSYLITNFAYFLFWALLIWPKNSLSFAAMAWHHVAGPIPSMFLWYSYLEHSKRIRATFPFD